MPQRKKKANPASQQKVAKAQHRNEFINHLKSILDKSVGTEVFRLIPQQEIEKLYKFRCHPVRVKAAPQQEISAIVLKDLKFLLTFLFKNNYINIGIGRLSEMSLYDYFSIGFTITSYAIRLKEDAYTRATEVKKALAPFAAIENSHIDEEAGKQYSNIMTVISMFNNDISNKLYALKYRQISVEEGATEINFYMEVYSFQAPRIQVAIDKHNRPAYQLCWPVSEFAPGLNFISVPSELVHLPGGSFLSVYIQSHALNRLSERIDGFNTGFLHFNIFESFKNPVFHKNKQGDILFEFKISGNKAGYFKADIIDGQIILRTFLFLTNNGTPESERLYAGTGIRKEDKVYLTIDKLSTFLNSDIASNERVKKIFIEAGCESLFRIDKSLYIAPERTKERSIADFIAKYLQLDTNHTPSYDQ